MLESCSKWRGDMMGRGRDDGSRTVDCLRGRLAAERVASKAAKADAELMAKRLEELERQMAAEIKNRDKAEKRLNRAIKKLESLKLMDVTMMNFLDSSVSSSSSACFSGEQRSEGWKFGSEIVNSGQCGSAREGEEKPGFLVSNDIGGDESSGDSSVGSPLPLVCQQEGSWSSVGTGHSHNKQEPSPRETLIRGGCDPPVSNALRKASTDGVGDDEPGNAKHPAIDHEDNRLALVPANMWSSSGDCKPHMNNDVQGVLEALRHVKEQLENSIARRAPPVPSHNGRMCIASE